MAPTIPDPGFAGDLGGVDPALADAQRAYADDPARLPEVLAALHRARVLAPVVAVLGEAGTGASGLPVDKTSDVALPVLEAGDGARAVPVFSGLEALALWDPAARPVPVEGPRAAAVALAEGAETVVLDAAGPHPVPLGPAELRALLDGRGTVPAYADPALARLLAEVLVAEPQARAAWLSPCRGVDARLTVGLAPGADPGAVAERLGQRLRALVAVAVRGLDVALTTDDAPPVAGRPVFRRL